MVVLDSLPPTPCGSGFLSNFQPYLLASAMVVTKSISGRAILLVTRGLQPPVEFTIGVSGVSHYTVFAVLH